MSRVLQEAIFSCRKKGTLVFLKESLRISMREINYLASKPHYELLDGLRGVAAVLVVCFHLLEAHSGGNHLNQIINHGYLAVDFFFMLSGYVIGYAYDDRWDHMSMWSFFKRRLVRLHPLVILGSLFGVALFYFQKSAIFPKLEGTPVSTLLLVMLLGCTLLPLPLKYDIRGWTEIHPLNGPAWSLYFEYIGNILYALVIRRVPTFALAFLVAVAGGFTICHGVTSPTGDMVGGWALNWEQQSIGFIRLAYPFAMGLLMARLGWKIRVKGAFGWASLLLFVILALPRFGGTSAYWVNGLYEALAIIFVFPVIVLIGAGGTTVGKISSATCKFFGDISYPIYITHFPMILIYTAWAANTQATIAQGLPWMILCVVLSITVAFIALEFYDKPLRRWLTDRILKRTKEN